MTHWSVNLRGHMLNHLAEFKKFQQQQRALPDSNYDPLKNKENLFSLTKKRVNPQQLRLQLPNFKRKKCNYQKPILLMPLVDSQQSRLEHRSASSLEVDQNDTQREGQGEAKTDRVRTWRLRKCSNAINLTRADNATDQTAVSLLNPAKHILKEREVGRLKPLFQKNPLLVTKKAIDPIVRDKIEGWQRLSSNSDHSDGNLILRDIRRV